MGYLWGNEFSVKEGAQVEDKYLPRELLPRGFKYCEMAILHGIKL